MYARTSSSASRAHRAASGYLAANIATAFPYRSLASSGLACMNAIRNAASANAWAAFGYRASTFRRKWT